MTNDLRGIDDERIARLRAELSTPEPETEYFAVSLVATDEGSSLAFWTHWVGWADGSPEGSRWELREASLVDPQAALNLWGEIGQGGMVVSDPNHLMLFLRAGGNALIAAGVARRWFPTWLEPRACLPDGPVGFVTIDRDAREVTRRAPTPKQRMRVLRRDGFRCQLCGERPSDNPHVTLHVHHIRPFSTGGLTADSNLITLCHTCHIGLDPHEQLSLFHLPGGHLQRALDALEPDQFHQNVATYRQRMTARLSNN